MRKYVLTRLAFLAFCAAGCADGLSFEDGSGAAGGQDVAGGAGGGGNGGGANELCGNNVIDMGEKCDGAMLAGWTCEALEYDGGALLCDPMTCQFDVSQCITAECNNGVREGAEGCDGTDFGGDTCTSLGFSGGTIACDPDCMVVGCVNDYLESFDEGAGLPPGMTTSGSGVWSVTTATAHNGTQSLQSGAIGSSASTTVSTTLTFSEPGTITFWHSESTESCCDHLRFYIDGVQMGQWSGTGSWAQSTSPVTVGTHTMQWTYSKDSTVNAGSDAVWIDEIVATNGTLQ